MTKQRNPIAIATGGISHGSWQKLSLVLIAQFLGMLMLAWATRSSAMKVYMPFRNYISNLGLGRQLGNPGGWIFLACFCLFAVLLIPWHLHMFRKVWSANRFLASLLVLISIVSIVGVSFVGIFDGSAMGPFTRSTSRFLHDRGADTAFGGHCAGAILLCGYYAFLYLRTSREDRRCMASPIKIVAPVAWLVLVLVGIMVVPGYGNAAREDGWRPSAMIFVREPFWQWSLMLSLMNYLFWTSRWFPERLGRQRGL